LLHLLTDTCDFDDQVLVSKLLGDLHTARHAAHLDGGSGDTSVALSIVLLNIDTLITKFVAGVYVGTLVELLCLRSIALVLDLGSELSADILLTFGSDLLCQLESSEPILKIHTHVKGELRLRTAQEHVLSQIRLEEDASDVAHQHILLSLILDAFD